MGTQNRHNLPFFESVSLKKRKRKAMTRIKQIGKVLKKKEIVIIYIRTKREEMQSSICPKKSEALPMGRRYEKEGWLSKSWTVWKPHMFLPYTAVRGRPHSWWIQDTTSTRSAEERSSCKSSLQDGEWERKFYHELEPETVMT